MEKQVNKCVVEGNMETDFTDFTRLTRGNCIVNDECATCSCLPVGLLLCEEYSSNGFEYSCWQQKTADLIIQAEDSLFQVHKSVISKNSIILGRMINTNISYDDQNERQFGGEDKYLPSNQIQRIHIKNFQAVDIKVLLDLMYYPEKKVNDSNVLTVLCLAEEFQVGRLKNICEKFLLRNKRHYHPFDLINTASQYNLSDALNCAVRMASSIPRVEYHEEFDALDPSIKEKIRQRHNSKIVVTDLYNSATHSRTHVNTRPGVEVDSFIVAERQQRPKSKINATDLHNSATNSHIHLNAKMPRIEGPINFSTVYSSSIKEEIQQRCNSKTVTIDVYNNTTEIHTNVIVADLLDDKTVDQLDTLSLDIEDDDYYANIEDEDYYADSEEGFSDNESTAEIPRKHDHHDKKCFVKSIKSPRKLLRKVFTRIINMVKD